MLIYNTTFHVEASHVQALTEHLCSQFVPTAAASGFLKKPKVRKVLKFDDEKGESICVQFHVKNMDTLNYWLETEGHTLHQAIVQKFGQSVAGFSTLLEEMDWEK